MHVFEQFSNWKFYLLGSYPTGELGGLAVNIQLAAICLFLSFIAGAVLVIFMKRPHIVLWRRPPGPWT